MCPTLPNCYATPAAPRPCVSILNSRGVPREETIKLWRRSRRRGVPEEEAFPKRLHTADGYSCIIEQGIVGVGRRSQAIRKWAFPANAQKIIEDEYFGDTEDPAKIRDIFLDLMGDLAFLIPTVQLARNHRDAGSLVFFYEFLQRPSMYGRSRLDHVKADHYDEVGFVFGAPFWTEEIVMLDNTTREERQLSKIMMKYWSNFAKTGNPNGQELFEWPAFSTDEQHLLLNLTRKLGNIKEKSKIEFWTERLPKRLKSESDNSRRNEL